MASACGNKWVRPPSEVASGAPWEATSRAASVRAAASETCCPSTARVPELEAIDGSRQPQPRRLRDEATEDAIGAELLGHGLRVGIEVEHSPAPLHGRGEVAEIVEPEHGANVVGLRRQLGHARTVGQPQRAPVGRAHHLFDAGHCARGEELHHRVAVERSPTGKPKDDDAGRSEVTALASSAHVAGCRREDLSDRVVELPDAREAGSECHAREGQLGRLDEHARALSALCPGERDRPRTDFRSQLSIEMPLAVAEPASELRDSPGVDHAVCDEAHRAVRRGRRARSIPASRGWRRAGNAGTRGTRLPGPRPPWDRSER